MTYNHDVTVSPQYHLDINTRTNLITVIPDSVLYECQHNNGGIITGPLALVYTFVAVQTRLGAPNPDEILDAKPEYLQELQRIAYENCPQTQREASL